MRKVEPLPTRDCEAGYGPDKKSIDLGPNPLSCTSALSLHVILPLIPNYKPRNRMTCFSKASIILSNHLTKQPESDPFFL